MAWFQQPSSSLQWMAGMWAANWAAWMAGMMVWSWAVLLDGPTVDVMVANLVGYLVGPTIGNLVENLVGNLDKLTKIRDNWRLHILKGYESLTAYWSYRCMRWLQGNASTAVMGRHNTALIPDMDCRNLEYEF